jgi:hypothetical protein
MRTTLTLDDDVAARLKAAVKRQRRPFRAIVNDVLRLGLAGIDKRPPRRHAYRTTGFDLGTSLVGSLDNVEDVLLRVEGEHRR